MFLGTPHFTQGPAPQAQLRSNNRTAILIVLRLVGKPAAILAIARRHKFNWRVLSKLSSCHIRPPPSAQPLSQLPHSDIELSSAQVVTQPPS